uniref:Acyl-CoA thioester hydrolase n=1 Tax=uncultured Prevotella sp. TaxID=159272 RepID=A0A6G8F0W3_9BACT|nr:acyl-CoA thioester hydrolase [uncultured Prevotella sp.]
MEEEPQQVTFSHQIPAQLRFSDVDRFGHVNNSVYFSLFDMSKERYFMDVVGKNALQQVSIVVANINANFLAPIYYPDEIVIQTSVVHLGNKSFTLRQRAVNVRTKEVKCDCRTVMVCFDMNDKVSIPMPDYFKSKIAEFEGHSLS